MPLSHWDLIGRIAIGALMGGIIGFERDIHGRPVGLRTHLLVAMAAATFMVISSQFVYFQNYGTSMPVEVDASRIAASVVSGIGFLAGGAILKTGLTIQGLTTAAGLWLVTAIGLCTGAGMYIESIAVTFMGLLALTFLRKFEDKNDKLIHRFVKLRLNSDASVLPNLMASMTKLKVSVSHFDYEKKIADKIMTVEFEVKYPAAINSDLIEILEKQTGLIEIHVSERRH